MTELLHSLSTYIQVSDALSEEITARMKLKSFDKGEILHHAQDICVHSFFIETGILRLYFLKDGKEVTEVFSGSGEWLNSPRSFMQQTVDEYYIDVLEPARVYVLNVNDLGYLFNHFPEMETYSRLSMGSTIGHLLDRLTSLRFTSAAEKYEQFCKDYAGLYHQLPLGMVASYLGIARETLSRIRKHP